MKNRRRAIALFVLFAVMCLAVGYASLSDSLLIGGSATASYEDVQKRFDENIYFYSAMLENAHQACGKCEAKITVDPDVAEMNVSGFGTAGDSVQAVFIINNDNADVDAEFAIPTIMIDGMPTSEYFYVETDWTSEKIVPAGGNITIKVTVTLIKTPAHLTAGESVSANFTLTLDSVSVSG